MVDLGPMAGPHDDAPFLRACRGQAPEPTPVWLIRPARRPLPAYPPRLADGQPPEPLSLGMRGPIEDDEWRLLANEPDYLPRGRRRSRK